MFLGLSPEPTIEIIHGIAVPDPYRWLEDRSSPESQDWLADQRRVCEGYFAEVPELDDLRARIQELSYYDSVDQVARVQQRYFYRKRPAGSEQFSIFVRDSVDATERLLVDPRAFGTYAWVGINRISPDGSLLAYELKQGGEHTKSIHIVDVSTGATMHDQLQRGLARGFAFHQDNGGYYYCHEEADASTPVYWDHQIKSHRLGSSPHGDIALLTVPRSPTSKLVLRSDGNELQALLCDDRLGVSLVDFYHANKANHGAWTCVCHKIPAPFGPIFIRNRLFAQRFDEALNGEVVEIDLATGNTRAVIIPEWTTPIKEMIVAGGKFYVSYFADYEWVVRIWTLEGDYAGSLELEPMHTWHLLPTFTNEEEEFFLQCDSFAQPATVMSCHVGSNRPSIWAHSPATGPTLSVNVRRLRYNSKDGTSVTMSLVAREGVHEVKNMPVVMTGYGGFGVPMTPYFSVLATVMLELGFILALPGIRGGGEMGEAWSEAARGRKRQNAFDDFISAADWLCATGVTRPEKLCAFGACNGALLVGAVVVQRPELFRAALCIAPLLDMVRYERFDKAVIWNHEYGSIADPEDFAALYSYSPYHNVQDGTNYPSTLLVTGEKDTRCNPAHALKMAARLQDRSGQKNAVLLDYSVERGHSPTMPTQVRLDAIARRVAFFCRELGIPIALRWHHDETAGS
jgi:prolyl oligopeptidase